MNYNTLKKLYESLPYVFKAPFSGVLRNKLIKNPIFLENYNKLQESEKWSDEQFDLEQFNLLKESLIHAYEHTKYYKELFDENHFTPYDIKSFDEIDNIPVLTKDMLKENFNELIADDGDAGYLVTTGGTSGEPTQVMMSNEAYYIEWAFVYDFWSKYGYDYKNSRLATFRGIKLGNKLYEINPMYKEIRMNVFSMGRSNIRNYVNAIKKYHVDFIYGYPSAIYNFCKLSQEANISLAGIFKAALLISENLYEFQEKKIKEVLQCKIGMFYGHSERAVFAGKFENGYRFNRLYGYTEINDKNEPVVTGFINKKTPLIRYLVDDKVTYVNNSYLIEGHHDGEVLYGIDGEEISAASINFHDATFEKINTYQFIQNKPGVCTLLVIPKEKINDIEKDKILKSVNEKLGNSIICSISVGDKPILTKRGKYKMIIHE